MIWLRGLVGVLVMLASGSAAAQVAFVIETDAQVVSKIEAPQPIAANTTLDLGASGKIVLLHLQSCQEITVKGGVLAISQDKVEASGNTQSFDSRDVPCPLKVSMDDGRNGLRAGTGLLPTQPGRLFFAGARRKEYVQAIFQQGNQSVTVGISRGIGQWPQEKTLVAHEECLMTVHGRGGVTAHREKRMVEDRRPDQLPQDVWFSAFP